METVKAVIIFAQLYDKLKREIPQCRCACASIKDTDIIIPVGLVIGVASFVAPGADEAAFFFLFLFLPSPDAGVAVLESPSFSVTVSSGREASPVVLKEGRI